MNHRQFRIIVAQLVDVISSRDGSGIEGILSRFDERTQRELVKAAERELVNRSATEEAARTVAAQSIARTGDGGAAFVVRVQHHPAPSPAPSPARDLESLPPEHLDE